MDRASDFGSEGWGFKSLRARVVMSRRPALPPHVVKVHPTPNRFARRPVRPTAEPGSGIRTGVRDPNRGPGSEPGHQRTTLTPTRPTSAGRGTGWGHVGLGDQPPAETGISQVKIAEPRTKVRSSELVSPESSLSKSSSLSLLVFSTKHDRISSVMVTPAPNA